jgi:hypothetical protein
MALSATSLHFYAHPQHVVPMRRSRAGSSGSFWLYRAGDMHNAASELRRILLPRTWVNKGKKKDRSYYDVPVLPSVIRLLGAYDNNYARAPRELR